MKPIAAAIIAAALGPPEGRSASLTVATLAESSFSACTLRDALDSINGQADQGACTAAGTYGTADSVGFTPGLTGTITFFTADPLANPPGSSALVIRRSMSIHGPGSGAMTLQCGNLTARMLQIEGSASAVDLDGLTIANCNSKQASGGAIIVNSTNVQLTDVTLSANHALQNGGGMAVFGAPGATVTMTACTVTGNTANFGGGLYVSGTDAAVSIFDSTVSANIAGFSGGGAALVGSFAPQGGLAATNSTFSGNRAGKGAGLYMVRGNAGSLALANSTVANNQFGRGILVENTITSGGMTPADVVKIVDTIVDGNTLADTQSIEPGQPGGVMTWDVSWSLIGDPDNVPLNGTGNVIGGPPPFGPGGWLGPLQNNGGPTLTHALLNNVPNPAIDAGDPSFSGLKFDQRGAPFKRVVNGRVDIGAFEAAVAQTIASQPIPAPRGLWLALLSGLLAWLGWRLRPRR